MKSKINVSISEIYIWGLIMGQLFQWLFCGLKVRFYFVGFCMEYKIGFLFQGFLYGA